MKRLLSALTALSLFLERAAIFVATSSLLLMTICILIQIVARYILSEPPAWTEDGHWPDAPIFDAPVRSSGAQ